MLYKVVLTFKSVVETLVCDHSKESYWIELSCGRTFMFIMLCKMVPSRKSVDETLVFEQYFIVVLFLIAVSTVCFYFLVHSRIVLRIWNQRSRASCWRRESRQREWCWLWCIWRLTDWYLDWGWWDSSSVRRRLFVRFWKPRKWQWIWWQHWRWPGHEVATLLTVDLYTPRQKYSRAANASCVYQHTTCLSR